MPALCCVCVQLGEEAGLLAPSYTRQLPGAPSTHEGTTCPAPTMQAGGLVKFSLFGLHVLTGMARVIRAPMA
jgi:hypothetical protein